MSSTRTTALPPLTIGCGSNSGCSVGTRTTKIGKTPLRILRARVWRRSLSLHAYRFQGEHDKAACFSVPFFCRPNGTQFVSVLMGKRPKLVNHDVVLVKKRWEKIQKWAACTARFERSRHSLAAPCHCWRVQSGRQWTTRSAREANNIAAPSRERRMNTCSREQLVSSRRHP